MSLGISNDALLTKSILYESIVICRIFDCDTIELGFYEFVKLAYDSTFKNCYRVNEPN